MTTWSAAQVWMELAHDHESPMLRALYTTALLTGMRPGELRGLKWQDVHLDRGYLICRRTTTRDASFRAILGETTKTEKGRSIHLVAGVVTALREHQLDQKRRRLAHPAWHDDNMVFDRGDGHFLSQQQWQRAHLRLIETLGLPRIRLHDLRHTAATHMLERNVHPKIVADVLGHSRIEITLNRYSHVSVDLQRAAMESVVASLGPRTETRQHG